MEHLSTSFFRSMCVGSFKEHRLAFMSPRGPDVTPYGTGEKDIKQVEADQKDILDQLSGPVVNPDVRTRATLFVMRAAINHPAAAKVVRDRLNGLDTADNELKKLNKENTEAVQKFEKNYTAADGPGKEKIVGDMGSRIESSLKSMRDLIAASPRPVNLDARLAELRAHVNALQNARGLSTEHKNRLTQPFSREMATDNPSKLRLGRGYLKAKGFTLAPAPAAPDTFVKTFATGASQTKITMQWKNDGTGTNKWHVTAEYPGGITGPFPGVEVTVDDANAQFTAANIKTEVNAGRNERAQAFRDINAIINSMDKGVQAAAPDATIRKQVQDKANDGNRAAEDAELKASTDAQTTFFTSIAVPQGQLEAARKLTPPNPEAVKTATEAIVKLFNNRRDAIYKRMGDITQETADHPRSSNLSTQLDVLNKQLTELTTRRNAIVPPARPSITTSTASEALPEGEQKVLDAFNKFLGENADVRALVATSPVGQRQAAEKAIAAQLPSVGGSARLRERAQAAINDALRSKGHAIDTINFAAPGTLTLRQVTTTTPETTPEGLKRVEAFMKTIDGNVKTLNEALRTNAGNLSAAPVRSAMEAITKRLTPDLTPADRQEIANRLTSAVGTAATATTEGRRVQYNTTTNQFELVSIARLPAAPPAKEQKEIFNNMGVLLKLLMELLQVFRQNQQQMLKIQGEQFQKLYAQRERALRLMQQSAGNPAALAKARADYQALDKRYQQVLAERDRAIAQIGKARQEVIRIARPAKLVIDEAPNYVVIAGRREYAPRMCVRPPLNYATLSVAEQGRVMVAMNSVATTASTMGCTVTTTPSIPVPAPTIASAATIRPSAAPAATIRPSAAPRPGPRPLVQAPAAVNISVGNISQSTVNNISVRGNNNVVSANATSTQVAESANKVNVVRPNASTGPNVASAPTIVRPGVVPPTNPGSLRG